MGKMRLMYNNLFDAGTLTVSAEADGFPKENLKHIWPSRPWRSTGTADEWFKVDFGDPVDITALVVHTHNIPSGATITIQAHEDNTHWGAPDLNTELTRTAGKIVKFWDSAQTFQWWRFRMQGGGGDGYRQIGRMFFGTYFEFNKTFNIKHPILIDPSTILKSSGGQLSANEKAHFSIRNYNFRVVNGSDLVSLETIFDLVGQSIPYFLCEDPSSESYKTLYYVLNTARWDFKPVEKTNFYDFSLNVETMR